MHPSNMFTLRHELEMLFFIIAATAITLFFLVSRNKINQSNLYQMMPVFPTAEPTPTPPSPLETIDFDSPDGTKILTMKKQKTANSVVYSFSTSVKSDASQKLIFSKKEPLSQELSIPFNTWSPDNTYFFLKETTPALNHYYVFKSTESLMSVDQAIDIQALFLQKLPQYTLDDVTGWADPNLLVVNTKNAQAETGPSFWFEVSSKSFIQLSTHFY